MSFYSTELGFNDLIFMLQGAGVTLFLTVVSGLLGTALGAIIGWIRSLRIIVIHSALGLYIDVIRSVPLIIQFVLLNSFMAIMGRPLDPFYSGIFTLTVWIAAYVAEVVTAGLDCVPPEYTMAARGLGMSYFQDLIHVKIPIGIRAIFPSWTGLILGLMKDTSLIAVLGAIPPELLRTSQIIITRTQRPLLILLGAGLFYYIMCYVVTILVGKFENKWTKTAGVSV